MNRSELKTVIDDEGLVDACFLDEGSLREDSVVLERRESDWAVYLSGERAGTVQTTFRTFAAEEEALDHMLVKLRQHARVRRLFAEDN